MTSQFIGVETRMWMFLLYAAVLIAITVLVEVEYFGWSTIAVLASFVGIYFLWTSEVLGVLRTYGPWAPVGIPVYVALGVVWSFVKWWFYLTGYRRAFRDAKERFLQSRDKDAPPYEQEELRRYLAQNTTGRYHVSGLKRPRAVDNKKRIMAWTGFWFFSLVGTVLNDPVRRLCELSFSWFKSLYERMSAWIFAQDTELQ